MGDFNQEADPILRIRELPAPEGGRVESGPVRFGDDWAGVFLRGDDAMAWAYMLDGILVDQPLDDAIRDNVLRGLADLLRACVEVS